MSTQRGNFSTEFALGDHVSFKPIKGIVKAVTVGMIDTEKGPVEARIYDIEVTSGPGIGPGEVIANVPEKDLGMDEEMVPTLQ